MLVEKSEFIKKTDVLKSLISNKTPSNSGILVNGNTLYAGTYEIGMKTFLDIENSNDYFIIPAKALELIRNLPDGMIKIEFDKGHVNISGGKIKSRYQTSKTEEYVQMESKVESDERFDVSFGDFKRELQSVFHAVNDKILKQSLRGVLLEAKDGVLNIVGSDGYRVAWSTLSYGGVFKVIIPKITAKVLATLDTAEKIYFSWDNKNIKFKIGGYEIYSRVMDGDYINYSKVFKSYENAVDIDKSTLIESVNRALIADIMSARSPIICHFEGRALTISLSQMLSEYEEKIKLKENVHVDETIALNGRFLFEALRSFGEENILFHYKSPKMPVIIESGSRKECILPVLVPEK